MNELSELNDWYFQAEVIVDKLSEDRIEDIMRIALYLRQKYVEGKKDGVKEWNEAAR